VSDPLLPLQSADVLSRLRSSVAAALIPLTIRRRQGRRHDKPADIAMLLAALFGYAAQFSLLVN